jgi:flagellar assembly protein FliH
MPAEEFERALSAARAEGEKAAAEAARALAKRELEAEWKKRLEALQRETAEKWRGLAMALADQASKVRQALHQEVTEAAFVAVVRLVGERAVSPEQVGHLVTSVIEESGLAGPYRVLLHPGDLKVVAEALADSAELDQIEFQADDRVTTAGCIVEGPEQTLDARLDVQLTLLKRQLDQLRRNRQQALHAP